MNLQKPLLRIATTGNVDDGKSTLMGRLLLETQSIFEDQFEAIRRTSEKRGRQEVDLSLLLDGLAAEREQAVTIDVAYRYFETQARKFILADCPGHEQYTRNMVTGASTADCAVVLIDARNGVQTQSRRHGFLLSLLQIPNMIVAINKMDLVDYAEAAYTRIVEQYLAYSRRLEIPSLTFLPVSALNGDNVTTRSTNMPWYEGPTLLQALEAIHVTLGHNLIDFRFPVQYVIRPHHDFRGFAGRIASGTIRPGEPIAVLPSGRTSTIKSIETFDGPLQEAFAPQSVVLTLSENIDVSRGCMLVRPRNVPAIGNHLDATLCWLDESPLRPGTPHLLKHTARTVKAFVSKLIYRLDVDTLHRQEAEELAMNDLGRVEIQATLPLFFDPYKLNRATGSFVLIDMVSNHTVAAGIIRGKPTKLDESDNGGTLRRRSAHTVSHQSSIPRATREARNGHRAFVLWLTGLSGSGKTTIGQAMQRVLHDRGFQTTLLDGDQLRQGLCGDLGFSRADRTENIRRAGEVARLFFESGQVVICSFISPIASDRAFVRGLVPDGRFVEIYVECALEVCISRDPNGLYGNALTGDIKDFTGISSTYEIPDAPEVTVRTDRECTDGIVSGLLQWLEDKGLLRTVAPDAGRPAART